MQLSGEEGGKDGEREMEKEGWEGENVIYLRVPNGKKIRSLVRGKGICTV